MTKLLLAHIGKHLSKTAYTLDVILFDSTGADLLIVGCLNCRASKELVPNKGDVTVKVKVPRSHSFNAITKIELFLSPWSCFGTTGLQNKSRITKPLINVFHM